MKKSDWGIEITKAQNGFSIKDNQGNITVVEEKENGGPSAAEALLQHIIEFFSLERGRYDRERISVIRQAGDKYEPQKDEKIVEEKYYRVIVTPHKNKKPRVQNTA